VSADGLQKLPYSERLEMATLGAMMLSRASLEAVATMLRPDDFYLPVHEMLFGLITDMYSRGAPVDMETVMGEVIRTGNLRMLPTNAYVVDLSPACQTPGNGADYARTVRELSILRRVALTATAVLQKTYAAVEHGGNAEELLAEAKARLDGIGGIGRTSTGVRFGEAVDEWLENISNPQASPIGWDWPWRDINEVLLPARRGQMVVFGARPKVGKSTALVDCVRHLAFRHGVPTVFFSLEMPREEVIDRIMAAEAEVGLTAIRNKNLTERQWDRLVAARDKLNAAPLEIFNEEATIADLRASIRAHGAQVLGYDYLQLAPVGATRDASHKGALLGQFAQNLKSLALSENVLVLTAAQLNRGPEQRADKRPQMADFRETGAIEQALDVAVMLHRPEAYNPTERAGECDFIVDGQRNGPKGQRTVVSQLHIARFADMGRP